MAKRIKYTEPGVYETHRTTHTLAGSADGAVVEIASHEADAFKNAGFEVVEIVQVHLADRLPDVAS